MSAWLFSKKSISSGLHDEILSSYVEVVNFLLGTFATDDVTARAVKYLENYKQALGMAPMEDILHQSPPMWLNVRGKESKVATRRRSPGNSI